MDTLTTRPCYSCQGHQGMLTPNAACHSTHIPSMALLTWHAASPAPEPAEHPETPTQPHSCLAGVAHTSVSPGGHHIPKSLPWIVAAAVLCYPPSAHMCLTQLWLSLSPCLPPAPPSLLPLRLCLELIPGVINYQFMPNLKFIIHFSHELPKVLSRGQDEGEQLCSSGDNGILHNYPKDH